GRGAALVPSAAWEASDCICERTDSIAGVLITTALTARVKRKRHGIQPPSAAAYQTLIPVHAFNCPTKLRLFKPLTWQYLAIMALIIIPPLPGGQSRWTDAVLCPHFT